MTNHTTPRLKTCAKCGATLPPPPPPRWGGHRPRRFCSGVCCDAAYRDAHREEAHAYRAAHREEERVYRATHREDRRARDAAYYKASPERGRECARNRRALKRNAPGTHTAADVAAQYERQHGRCYYCGAKVCEAYHVDHVLPLSKGGSNGPENLVIACPQCNMSKHDKLPHEFSGRLC